MGNVGGALLGGLVAGVAAKALSKEPPDPGKMPTVDPAEEEKRARDKRRRERQRIQGGFGLSDSIAGDSVAKGSKTLLGQ